MRKFKVKNKSIRRKSRSRAKIKRVSNRPRLSVFRSNRHIYAQIIDDMKGKTLLSVYDGDISKDKKKGKNKKELAQMVGELVAQKAKKIKVSKIVFDRGSYKYHGRVKALAEAARKGGLKF